MSDNPASTAAERVLGLASPALEEDNAEIAWNNALLPLQHGERATSTKLWIRIEAALDALNTVPGTRTLALLDGVWETLAPGIERKVVNVDTRAGVQHVMFRMATGTALPAHLHRADEHCIVIAGELRIGEERFGAGTYHFAGVDTEHPPIVAVSEALFYIAGAL